MRQALQKSLIAGVVVSETSHVLCCVLPTVFSLISLLVGMGLVAAMPGFLIVIHNFMHAWEVPIIAFSGVVLVLGWAITLYSDKIDCHHTGCAHGTCAPKKSRAHIVLSIATALFLFNLAMYAFVHRSGFVTIPTETMAVHDAHESNHPQ